MSDEYDGMRERTRLTAAALVVALALGGAAHAADDTAERYYQEQLFKHKLEQKQEDFQTQLDNMKRKQDEQRTMDCLFNGNCY